MVLALGQPALNNGDHFKSERINLKLKKLRPNKKIALHKKIQTLISNLGHVILSTK